MAATEFYPFLVASSSSLALWKNPNGGCASDQNPQSQIGESGIAGEFCSSSHTHLFHALFFLWVFFNRFQLKPSWVWIDYCCWISVSISSYSWISESFLGFSLISCLFQFLWKMRSFIIRYTHSAWFISGETSKREREIERRKNDDMLFSNLGRVSWRAE